MNVRILLLLLTIGLSPLIAAEARVDARTLTGKVMCGYEGLPSDFYLRLTGAGGKLLRGEIPLTDKLPALK